MRAMHASRLAMHAARRAVHASSPGNTRTSQDKPGQRQDNTRNKQKETKPLQFVVDMVPENAFKAMSNNKLMLQVIFFTIFLGISLLLVPEKQAKPLKIFFDSLNAVVLKMVDLIMLMAPIAVLSLLATVIVTTNDINILLALLRTTRPTATRPSPSVGTETDAGRRRRRRSPAVDHLLRGDREVEDLHRQPLVHRRLQRGIPTPEHQIQ